MQRGSTMSLIHTSGTTGGRGARAIVLGLALSGALATIASASSLPQQGKAVARARCSDCATIDSLRARHEFLLGKIDSLRYHFEHQRLSDTERERLSDEMTRTVLALKELFEQEARAHAVVAAQAGVEAARELRRMPKIAVAVEGRYQTRGYLGVVFDGTNEDRWRNNERIVRFYGYPRIAMVEPSSPAERAGILVGDTLLSLNGTDVKEREISLTRLLVPSQRITVRVRRDGHPKDFRVTVGEAPAYVMSRTPVAPMAPGAAATPPSPPSPARVYGHPGAEDPRRPPSPAGGQMWIFQEGIGGAKVESITEGLGKAVGVRSGVLVIRAAPGTPAFESGLRDGDVIVRAAGSSVVNVRQLRGVLAQQDDMEGVKLVIVRERKRRDVTLRWQ